MTIPRKDVQVLRRLATRIAELGADARMREKAGMWSRLDDLDTSARPMLLTHLCPLAWSQVLPDETTLVCEHPDAQRCERELRQRIRSEHRRTVISRSLGGDPRVGVWIPA